jgi:hypothetical protein
MAHHPAAGLDLYNQPKRTAAQQEPLARIAWAIPFRKRISESRIEGNTYLRFACQVGSCTKTPHPAQKLRRFGALVCQVTFLDFAQERGSAQKLKRLHKNARMADAEMAGNARVPNRAA